MATDTTTTPAPSAAQPSPRFQLTLAVLGAVCSAVLTGVLDRLDVSDTGKLVGLAVGAAVPPFVAVAGRRQHLRVAAALMLSVLAVVLSYGGWQLVAKVSGTQPIVPSPQQVVDELTGGGRGSADAVVMTEGDLGIRVTPGAISCDESGACNSVTVTSTGTGLLVITGLELDGGAPTTLRPSGCENAQLAQGDSCTVTLTAADGGPAAPASTRLVIHQNFTGPATYVPLVTDGGGGALPNLGAGAADCVVPDGDPDPGTGEVTGVLTIDAPLSWDGTSDPPPVVTAVVAIDGSELWTFDVDPAAGALHVSEEYVGPPPDAVTITVDPADQVAESDEGDNTAGC